MVLRLGNDFKKSVDVHNIVSSLRVCSQLIDKARRLVIDAINEISSFEIESMVNDIKNR